MPCLNAVFVRVVARKLGTAGAEFGHPFDHRHRQHWKRPAVLAQLHVIVRGCSNGRRRIANTLEIEIVAAIVGIDGPIIASLGIAPGPIQRRIEFPELIGTGEGNTINEITDHVPVGLHVHHDGRLRMGARRNEFERGESSQPKPGKTTNSSNVQIHNSFDSFSPGYRSILRARTRTGK